MSVKATPPATDNLEDAYPLAPLQEGMLFHTLYDPAAGVYVEQLSFLLRDREPFDTEAFRRAAQRVVERHPVLRTAFTWKRRKRPLQVVRRRVELPFLEEDWSGLPTAECDGRWQHLVADDRRRGFDPSRAPLARVTLVRLSAGEHRCLLSYHHLLMDAWSLPLVLRELLAFYDAFRSGNDLELPLPRPYRNYIAWLERQDAARAEGFWRQRLRGITAPTPLGVDRPAGAGGGRYERRALALPQETTEALEAFARSRRLTLGSLARGAWALLLGRYSGERDVVFGVTVSGRPDELPGVELMVGLFINTLPFRIDLPPTERLAPWLQRVQERQLELREHEHTPLVAIQGWSEVPRHLPLFESILVFENAPEPSGGAAGGSLEVPDATYAPQSNYPLSLMIVPGRRLSLRALSASERLDGPTASRLLGHFAALLSGMTAAPDCVLADLPLLTPAERHQLVAEWNDTAAAYDREALIHALVAARAAADPAAPAVLGEGGELSHGELDRRANRLAHLLVDLGVGPGVLVGIDLHRSVEMVVAVLGVLKAGGAYVPLDVALPTARAARIVNALGVRHLVTESRRGAALAGLAAAAPSLRHAVLLETPGSWIEACGEVRLWTDRDLARQPDGDPGPRATAGDVAYVIFTSGSTGVPKGVVVRHRPVVNLIEWVNRTFRVGPADRVLFITSLGFDLSVYDVFGLLAAGGSVRVAGDDDLGEPARLLEMLHREPITFWDSAPAALQQLVPFFDAAEPRPGRLRLVFLSGDWVPVNLPGLVESEFPGVEVVALGGATEATVWSNFHIVREVPPGATSIPYGRPIRNARYHVLDASLIPCPIGVAGDLYIGGECLAAGYAREPVQTAERFIPDGFAAGGTVLYRTGDRARRFADGSLEFLGRVDQQVKIRGFRVEAGEVEAALLEHPDVRHAVVTARGAGGEKRLAAYVVPQPETELDVQTLRDHLAQRLPAYMVPGTFVPLAALPVTANGKLDRAALPDPERPQPAAGYAPPRSSRELRLVQIWEELFGIHPIGVRDDFFELGGHSLLAVRLLAEIQSRFDCDLPLRTLLAEATVEGLARRLAGVAANAWSPLVALQPRGSRPPLFCIHSGGGGVLSYVGLARHLGEDQPVYALEARGLEAGQEPLATVAEMADLYLEALRGLRPAGPYCLAGWSFGGYVAYDMAQRIRASGGEVAVLALLDTAVWRWGTRQDAELLADLLGERFPGLELDEMQRCGSRDELLAHLVRRAKELALVPPGFEVEQARRMFAVHRRHHDAAAAYTPAPYPGRLTLVRGRGGWPEWAEDRSLGWGDLALGGVEILEVSGGHTNLLDPPHDREVAARLRQCLDRLSLNPP